MIFTDTQLNSLNNLELEVYHYIINNRELVANMKIKELAAAVHVSPSTIMRFCGKVGFSGYSEFKLTLRNLNYSSKQPAVEQTPPDVGNVQRLIPQETLSKIREASALIHRSSRVICVGIGTSGILAKYAARYLTAIGKSCQWIEDPYYPYPNGDFSDTVVLALSVSGETVVIADRVAHFSKQGAKVVALTNNKESRIAKMAHVNLAYQVSKKEISNADLTTQLPTLYLIEALGQALYEESRLNPETGI